MANKDKKKIKDTIGPPSEDFLDPLVPKRVPAAGMITTGMTLQAQAAVLPGAPGSSTVEQGLVLSRTWTNDAAISSGGVAQQPTLLELSPDLAFTTGVYIMAAPTGAGKTILSMALASYCNAQGIPASYTNCFEPRAPTWSINERPMYKNPAIFWDDVTVALSLTRRTTPRVLIFDSVTLPLSAYASKDQFDGQTTFPGGMQPSSRGFTDEGSALALAYNAAIILNVNQSLVPYVVMLAGGTEGLIQVQDVSTFSMMDRSSTSKRVAREIVLPLPYVNSALAYFGYGIYNRSTTRKWGRSVIGI